MNQTASASDSLSVFSPAVRNWFTTAYGRPTPAQELGWPAIQRGENALILSPTGSGKTLAAFLWAIDRLIEELTGEPAEAAAPDPVGEPAADGNQRPAADRGPGPAAAVTAGPGVRTLYISPLKALNNDIQRNLRLPLAGIRRETHRLGRDLPDIRVAVRSGDTPPRERQAALKRPPHIYITTPESLFLLLTAPRAREMFRSVSTVIVDEIHTLAGTKRGAHLALSLERLEELTSLPPQRIGLSATIRPLEEVARFLGGAEWVAGGVDEAPLAPDRAAPGPAPVPAPDAAAQDPPPRPVLRPRPVTVVDAGMKKNLDLLVESVATDLRNLPGGSIWPLLIPRLLSLIRTHETTLIFSNNRRQAERIADRLNEQRAAEERGEPSGLLEQGVAKGLGFAAAGRGLHANPIRAHHGSMSREARLEMEQDLKSGRLDALVGTSSLQLGIDIGSVDLVVQVGSPKAVSEGLQRVGRAGHLVGQTSKGRIFPLHREDLMEAAVISRGMLRGEVEKTVTPSNPLDVLAQQIVAAVSVQSWDADALLATVRRARPFHHLTLRAYQAVLGMLAGRYPASVHRQLRARLSWDRVNNRLSALPGSRLLAVANAGTIPDHGMFGAYLPDGKTRIGELDEEFVFETRPGDSFMLGSQVWRVLEITEERVIVAESPGSFPRMPFWHGDYPWRPYELGIKVGEFRRQVSGRLLGVKERLGIEGTLSLGERSGDSRLQEALAAEKAWLEEECALDGKSAGQVLDYVASQLDRMGAISSDRSILVELFDDAVGEPRMVVHSPFGGRVNGPWGLVLAGALRERTGVNVDVQSNDDGILLRFHEAEAEFPLDLVSGMGPEEARRRLLEELPSSAVFGAQFRRNAARALMLPGSRPGKRTPFWLQRLRAKDLLQAVRKLDDFPLIAETYRDCLEDVMDLPALEQVLSGIQRGEIQVSSRETLVPSPVAQSLMQAFAMIYLYEWDAPKAERALGALTTSTELLQDLLRDVRLDELLQPTAVAETQARLQHTAPGAQARSADELALLLEELGDLSTAEAAQRSAGDAAGWLRQLYEQGRVVPIRVPVAGRPSEERWAPTELADDYRRTFGLGAGAETEAQAAAPETAPAAGAAAGAVLARYLSWSGPVNQQQICARYAFDPDWLQQQLDRLVAERSLAQGRFTPGLPAGTADQYLAVQALEQMHRHTLSLLRREVRPVPFTAYAHFLAEWQHTSPDSNLSGTDATRRVLEQLRGLSLPAATWERDLLPARVPAYDPAALDRLTASGEFAWAASGNDVAHARLAFFPRGEGRVFAPPPQTQDLPTEALAVRDYLAAEGAAFLPEIAAALGWGEEAVERQLLRLLLAGLVTNDQITTARRLLAGGRLGGDRSASGPAPALSSRSYSSLEQDLLSRRSAARAASLPPLRRPPTARLRAAESRVRTRLRAEESRAAGRWTLLEKQGIAGPQLPPDEMAERRARQLLARYGIVTSRSLEREADSWEWGDLATQLRRLEIRGEVRRGYFVRELPGIQYALPEAVERLRTVASRIPDQLQSSLIALNATDPANSYGPPAVSRLPSTWVVLDRGALVLVAADSGTRLSSPLDLDPGLLRSALEALLDRLRRHQTRITVETWNGESAMGGDARSLLKNAGFYPDHPGMTWDGYR